MELELLHTGPLGVNTYILSGEKEDQCIVIDPADARPVLRYIQQKKLRTVAVLLTHGHFDHILGVAALKEASGIKVYIHEADAAALYDPSVSLSNLSSFSLLPCRPDVMLQDEDMLNVAGFSIRVLHTPGHTAGGVCYLIEEQGLLFTGDTLFHTDVGRTDLPGGDAQTLYDSIFRKLFSLSGDYVVYPGHEESTTLAEERKHNLYMCREPSTW